MIYRFFLLGLLACAMMVGAFAADHPRILVGAGDVPALREKITREPWKSMYERMVADAELGQYDSFKAGDPWGEATNAFRCASLYMLTGDDAWAKKARGYVELRINDTTTGGKGKGNGWATGIFGLSQSFYGKNVAMAYDLCYGAPSWDADFSAKVSKKLLEEANFMMANGGSGYPNNNASNWVGIRYSSTGLCYMATDETLPADALKNVTWRVIRYVQENNGSNAKTSGWSIEGLGYTGYPWGHVGPYFIGLTRMDPKNDVLKLASVQMACWSLYPSMIHAQGSTIHPDFGDDNPGMTGDGCFGMAFRLAPAALQPGIKYWYDRTVGIKGTKDYDQGRGGTIYSILYYPDKLEEKNPLTIPEWRAAMADTGGIGMFLFRNNYNDKNDIEAQLYLKLMGNKGHNGPDALSFRIIGMDNPWAVGGGRYGGAKIAGSDCYQHSMNTLYPSDPDGALKTNGNSGKVEGTPEIIENGGGDLVAHIDVNNVGVKDHTRRFIAEYGKEIGCEAAYIICDTSTDGKFWQLATYEPNVITTVDNTFTITAPDGATMQGTVLYAAGGPRFKTGTRPRGTDFIKAKNNGFITLQSDDGGYVVVLTIAKKGHAHPAISATGTWGATPDGTVKVGNFTVTIKGDVVTR
ncbi:MAG: hypothetical protein WCJ56_05795 [bacterium]